MARIRGGVHQVSNADLTVMIHGERGVEFYEIHSNPILCKVKGSDGEYYLTFRYRECPL
jgi:hypothetical protein